MTTDDSIVSSAIRAPRRQKYIEISPLLQSASKNSGMNHQMSTTVLGPGGHNIGIALGENWLYQLVRFSVIAGKNKNCQSNKTFTFTFPKMSTPSKFRTSNRESRLETQVLITFFLRYSSKKESSYQRLTFPKKSFKTLSLF